MHKTPERKRLEENEKIIEILRRVPYERGFHFYTAPDNFTGETATSLDEFEKKLQIIKTDSVVFHFSRKDFQKWIKDTLGDNELAERMSQIKNTLPDQKLRKEIIEIVQTRIAELKMQLPHNLSHNDS
jgi:abortive infection bacteriophage resistance protein